MKFHKVSTHSAHSDNCCFHFFVSILLNPFSNSCWKFQLSILKNKKVLFLKKIFRPLSISKQKKALFTDPIFSEGFGSACELCCNLMPYHWFLWTFVSTKLYPLNNFKFLLLFQFKTKQDRMILRSQTRCKYFELFSLLNIMNGLNQKIQ